MTVIEWERAMRHVSGGFVRCCGVALSGLAAVVIGSAPAWAQGVPAPLAGEVGIVGLAAGGAVYVGYRLYTYFRGNR